jgi:hypothetical protein
MSPIYISEPCLSSANPNNFFLDFPLASTYPGSPRPVALSALGLASQKARKRAVLKASQTGMAKRDGSRPRRSIIKLKIFNPDRQ